MVLGKNENILYSYSYDSATTKISLLDINGNPYFQYLTLSGDINNNFIAYRALDDSCDMVVTSSGFETIGYTRFLSSSTSPYSIDSASSYSVYDSN